MNNPLAQKAQYYLNESYRLSEELKNETEYSELLENILLELLSEEELHTLLEFTFKGKANMTTKRDGTRRTPEEIAHLQRRFGQLLDIGTASANRGHDIETHNNLHRVIDSTIAAGGGEPHEPGTHFNPDRSELARRIQRRAMGTTKQHPEAAIQFGIPDKIPAERRDKGVPDWGKHTAETEQRRRSLQRRLRANPNYMANLKAKAADSRQRQQDQLRRDNTI